MQILLQVRRCRDYFGIWPQSNKSWKCKQTILSLELIVTIWTFKVKKITANTIHQQAQRLDSNQIFWHLIKGMRNNKIWDSSVLWVTLSPWRTMPYCKLSSLSINRIEKIVFHSRPKVWMRAIYTHSFVNFKSTKLTRENFNR